MPTAALDTNLVVLRLVGEIAPELLGQHRRVRSFGIEDITVLEELCRSYDRLIVTPHVLAETSNLVGSGTQQVAPGAAAALSRYASEVEERHVSAQVLIEGRFAERFGFADASLIALAQAGVTILTEDFPLDGWLRHAGLPTVNFSHYRFGGS